MKKPRSVPFTAARCTSLPDASGNSGEESSDLSSMSSGGEDGGGVTRMEDAKGDDDRWADDDIVSPKMREDEENWLLMSEP